MRSTAEAATISQQARQLVSELILGWTADAPLDARGVLAQHPELADVRSVVLDLVNEEYCQRLERGEVVDPIEFARRFPAHEPSVLRLLQLHALFAPGSTESPTWPSAGETFGRYKLIEEIGRGAFSRVFYASDQEVGGRRVVLKICTRGDGEADLLGRLDHPGIVPVLTAGNGPEGHHFLCMPDLGRQTLAGWIESVFADANASIVPQLPLDIAPHDQQTGAAATASLSQQTASHVDQIVSIAIDLADALAHAHARGIRHGDVKPSNVLIRADGRGMLLDFNLASASETTRMGGTPAYMAPDVLRTLLDERSSPVLPPECDLFSLGVTLYQALSGMLPFGSAPTAHDQLCSRSGAVPPLTSLNPQVEPQLAGLIHRCLADDPTARPGSAVDLARELRAYASTARRTRRWLKQNRREALAALALGLAGMAGGGLWWSRRDPFVVRQLTLGRSRLAARDWSAAIDHYESVLARQPDHAAALFERGRARLHLGRFVAASQDFSHCARISEDGRASACSAYAAVQVNHYYDVGITYGSQALKRGFATAEVHNNLGYCHFMCGNCSAARRHLNEALRLRPKFTAAMHTLALVDLKESARRNKEPDVKLIEQALASAPQHAKLQFNAACVYCQAAKATRDRTARDELLIDVFKYAEAALALGLPPDQLAILVELFPDIAGDERFLALSRRPALQEQKPPIAPIVDPMRGRDEF